MTDLSFYKGKNVFITGHTGFKGTWLCRILLYARSNITGYALPPATNPSLFLQTDTQKDIKSIIGDITDTQKLKNAMQQASPDIVFHLAAQPLVRLSYKEPLLTYKTNVMGTVNVLEAVRATASVKSFVNITTDKVYKNKEWFYGYRENEELCGFDPYSNSKSCSELVTYSYKNSFFNQDGSPAISTARSGNVIGGGDYSLDRIIPDCIKAAQQQKTIIIRNPQSTRPYQHVLECLSGYLLLAQKQYKNKDLQGNYNFGPNETSNITTGDLATLFCKQWAGATWQNISEQNAVHEANFLRLDCQKAKTILGWQPHWDINTAIKKVVEWQKAVDAGKSAKDVTLEQIKEYFQTSN